MMSYLNWKRWATALGMAATVAAGGVTMVSCGGDDPVETAAVSYAGPGSFFSIALSATTTGSGTFTVEVRETSPTQTTADMIVTGSYLRLDTGFVKLVVGACTTGAGAACATEGPDAGDEAYGLEVYGMVFLVAPIGSEGEIIPMVAAGTCPTSDVTYNWIQTNSGGDNPTTNDAYGTATFDVSDFSAAIENKGRLSDYTSAGGAGSAGPGDCESGIVNLTGDDVTMWLTQAGGAIVRAPGGSGDHIIIAMPQNEVALTDLAGVWNGVVFDGGDSQEPNFAIKLTVGASGASGTPEKYTNVESGTVEAIEGNPTVTFSNVNEPINDTTVDGFVRMDVNGANAICAVTLNAAGSGHNTMFCSGISPGDGASLYSVILVK